LKSSNTNLGVWNIYFIIKLILVVNGIIELNFLKNIAFIAFLLMPLENKNMVSLRQVIAIPLACLLFYEDSYLPPIWHLFTQLEQISKFDISYLYELLTRFVSLNFVLIVFVSAVFYVIFYKVLRVTVLVIAGMTLLQITHTPHSSSTISNETQPIASANTPLQESSTALSENEQLNNYRKEFFKKQASLNISFREDLQQNIKFDILALSICSLAWEDIKYFNLENHKLLKEFDILFDNFNSATSYSGPALVRFLQANCGQKPHLGIMSRPSDQKCYLLNNLKELGFNTELILNHSGLFDNFTSLVQERGGIDVNPTRYNSKPYLVSFDKSPIQRDKDIFSQWLQNRDKGVTDKMFTLYNTVSLHDGNHFENNMEIMSSETYGRRLITLLDDLYEVIEGLKKSNRPIVVLLVPEHGANIRGDNMQIAGMRDLPSPGITNVPVGLKIIGNNIQRLGLQKHVTQQSSYLAIAHLINQLLEQDIFGKSEFDPESLLQNIPQTPVLSENMLTENDGSIVMQYQNNYYYSFNNGEWNEYKQ
jgi:cellulose synthase operon protein YhjU